jgi:uncharacterized protein
MTNLVPVQPGKRVQSLDILRGIAILGILLMNTQSFSMINAAYINPTAFGDFTGINKVIWIITHVVADQKFLGLFSVLFGAGIVLFANRAEEKGKKAGKLHYKRMFFLLLFGLLHAYLLWHGDILVTYALCGLWVFLFRRKSVKTLWTWGIIFMIVPLLIYLMSGFSLNYMPEESVQQIMKAWQPDKAAVHEELMAFQGSWLQQMEMRAKLAFEFQTFLFLIFMGWKITGWMLIGMALFKSGILSNQKSFVYYAKLAVFGIVIGYFLSGYGVLKNIHNQWSLEYSMYFGSMFNYVGSVFTVIGYIGLVMLLVNKKFMSFLFQKTGRLAFTNYILETAIFTTVFYGHGFGFYGKMDRFNQFILVVVTWIIIITFSRLWLKYFRYGPLEWVWRSLTYGRMASIYPEKGNNGDN